MFYTHAGGCQNRYLGVIVIGANVCKLMVYIELHPVWTCHGSENVTECYGDGWGVNNNNDL